MIKTKLNVKKLYEFYIDIVPIFSKIIWWRQNYMNLILYKIYLVCLRLIYISEFHGWAITKLCHLAKTWASFSIRVLFEERSSCENCETNSAKCLLDLDLNQQELILLSHFVIGWKDNFQYCSKLNSILKLKIKNCIS